MGCEGSLELCNALLLGDRLVLYPAANPDAQEALGFVLLDLKAKLKFLKCFEKSLVNSFGKVQQML